MRAATVALGQDGQPVRGISEDRSGSTRALVSAVYEILDDAGKSYQSPEAQLTSEHVSQVLIEIPASTGTGARSTILSSAASVNTNCRERRETVAGSCSELGSLAQMHAEPPMRSRMAATKSSRR